MAPQPAPVVQSSSAEYCDMLPQSNTFACKMWYFISKR